jgi:hypothetical protein
MEIGICTFADVGTHPLTKDKTDPLPAVAKFDGRNRAGRPTGTGCICSW